ncbi:hypothetical protein K505DRAFT_58521 [Melanomma pulvis-pyrius CBS 109.77]|uniref:Rhodopsin domain-containing protein n=1 Tax=Melanomma pulvis-pyrius CBS 109.77 TaxID=1314802 RepID=A0A6A6X7T8_9PLEO|nr:hypothetical protein K505DRAFT_58521 [Melanomma pulvis-pyrius CBS 109.77]
MAPPMPTVGIPTKAPDYSDRGPNIIACAVILLIVPSVAVIIRLWSRTVASRSRFWWDDFWLLITLLFSHLYLIMNIWGVSLGLGKHQWMVPLTTIKPNLMNLHLGLTFYGTAITVMKLSALALYARLFRVSTRVQKFLWALGIFVIAFWMVLLVVPWTNCTPLKKTINPLVPGKCTTRIGYYITAGVFNLILDFVILLTPVPLIWRLTLTRIKKIQVSLVFLLGYGSAFVSLTRLIIIAKKPAILSAAPGSDPSWDTVPLLYVSMLEAPFGIVALCGPPVNQIINRARNYGWRSLLSTRQYHSPTTSDKAPSLEHPNGSGSTKFGLVRRKPSNKSLDKSLFSTQADEMPEVPNIQQAHLSTQRGGHQGEYLELGDLSGKAA